MSNKQSRVDMEFVPDEEALALKELGFNEPCCKYIYLGDTGNNLDLNLETEPSKSINFNSDSLCVSRPTFSQAFRWFRENYKLEPEVLSDMMGYVCSIVDRNKPLKTSLTPSNLFQTYEEAELVCLRRLIEIVKGKQNDQK